MGCLAADNRKELTTMTRPDFAELTDRELLLMVASSYYDFAERLQGNGQPGLCQVRGARLDAIEARIGTVEKFKEQAHGALSVLSIVGVGAMSPKSIGPARRFSVPMTVANGGVVGGPVGAAPWPRPAPPPAPRPPPPALPPAAASIVS